FYESDISNSGGISETIENIILQDGKIDILVNNAGITKDAILIKMSDDDWNEVINVNLNGLFYIVKNVIKYMIKAKAGKIINISSVIGESGNAGQANYASAKAGIIAFTKSIAKEYASRNIYVNAIAPGFIGTDMTDKLNETVKNNIKKEIPLNRFGAPEDVSNAVLFLASNLSDYITGATIDVNGGMYMR
ncbi:MAG: 3-oxoacyl-ACP reductase FabG, partial [bacterium]